MIKQVQEDNKQGFFSIINNHLNEKNNPDKIKFEDNNNKYKIFVDSFIKNISLKNGIIKNISIKNKIIKRVYNNEHKIFIKKLIEQDLLVSIKYKILIERLSFNEEIPKKHEKSIPLYLSGEKKGVAWYDIEDYEEISKYKFHKNTGDYAATGDDKILMHKIIKKLPKGSDLVIDHKDHDKLNNTRDNLEIKTVEENSQNRLKKAGNSTSKYKYITIVEGKCMARIVKGGENIFVKEYNENDEEKAVFDVDMFIVHNNLGQNLNFPEKRDEYLSLPFIPLEKRILTSNYNGVCKVDETAQNVPIYMGKVTLKCKIYKTNRYFNPEECAIEWDKIVSDNKIPNKKLNFPNLFPNYDPERCVIKTFCEEYDDFSVKLVIKCNDPHGALLDKTDYEELKYYKFTVNDNKNDKEYGYVTFRKNKINFLVHRYLMNPEGNLVVDHIDGHKADNRKSQLKIVTVQQNNQNMPKQKGCTSEYLGVSYDKSMKKWVSKISHNGRKTFIYDSEEYAARARDLYIIENANDQNFRLSFEWKNEDIVIWKEKLKKTKKNKKL
jgi:hypothetical protein